MLQPATVADLHIRPDDTIRTDLAARAQACARIDDRSWMDLCPTHKSTKPNSISASDTTSLFTTQRPFARATFFLCCVISTSMKSVSPGTTGLRNFTSSALMKSVSYTHL